MGKDKRTKADLIKELESLQVSNSIESSAPNELINKVSECGDSIVEYHELRDEVMNDYECDSRKAHTIINNCRAIITSSNNLSELLEN